jgi:hypothetical protein
MCDIPLDLQRRFEQRWAARFGRPVPPAAPQNHEQEKQDQQPAAMRKGKRKTRRFSSAGQRSAAPAV